MAIDFDGTGDYIDCTSDASVDNIFDNVSGVGGLVSLWIYPHAWNVFILNKMDGSYINGFRLMTDNSLINAGLAFYHGFQYYNGWWTIDNVLALNTAWYHIMVYYRNNSTANNPEVWVNGVSKTVTRRGIPSGTRNSDAAYNLRIGADGNGSYAFDGRIADLRIYKPFGYNQTIMKGLYYAQGRELTGPYCNAHYRLMDGPVGSTLSGSGSVKNLVNHSADGTPNGNPVWAEDPIMKRRIP